MDTTLVRYLLGSLPEEEAQRFDELSIADDEFAARLKAAESDLIDAYVAGELTHDERGRFEAVFAASADGRSRIQFARALATRTTPTSRSRPRAWYPALAAAAIVLLAAGSYWVIQPERPGRQPVATPAQTEAVAPPVAVTEPPSAPPATAPPSSEVVLSFVLAAPTRSAVTDPQITLPKGSVLVELRLEIEGDDFPEYEAILKDAAGVRTLWRSARVKATGPGSNRIVPVRVPANLLTPRRHVLELRGGSPGGTPQILAAYPFRVVLQ